jgi:hypothetical protein
MCRALTKKSGSKAAALQKRHAVLLEVAQGFSGIPREHISVYTLIAEIWKAVLRAWGTA